MLAKDDVMKMATVCAPFWLPREIYTLVAVVLYDNTTTKSVCLRSATHTSNTYVILSFRQRQTSGGILPTSGDV